MCLRQMRWFFFLYRQFSFFLFGCWRVFGLIIWCLHFPVNVSDCNYRNLVITKTLLYLINYWKLLQNVITTIKIVSTCRDLIKNDICHLTSKRVKYLKYLIRKRLRFSNYISLIGAGLLNYSKLYLTFFPQNIIVTPWGSLFIIIP